MERKDTKKYRIALYVVLCTLVAILAVYFAWVVFWGFQFEG